MRQHELHSSLVSQVPREVASVSAAYAEGMCYSWETRVLKTLIFLKTSSKHVQPLTQSETLLPLLSCASQESISVSEEMLSLFFNTLCYIDILVKIFWTENISASVHKICGNVRHTWQIVSQDNLLDFSWDTNIFQDDIVSLINFRQKY